MSDTPRTDAEFERIRSDYSISAAREGRHVADFARQLERELNEANKNLAVSRDIVRNQRDFIAQLNEENQSRVDERDSLRAINAELEEAFTEFKSMLKASSDQRFDTEVKTQWLVELPMTHEQVAIWDKHMNPKSKESRKD
jgi:uncharacterized protein (DUF3084 family)